MASNINWQNLRSWSGSQQTGFEELCCQLAAYEAMPKGSLFTRKGAPDAGVECFWTLPDDSEWGLQAKFFFSMGESQWKQLDESVKTALEKHPNLSSYTICIPLDRQDPRIDKQQWFMDKWGDHCKNWQNLARQVGRTITFTYWGEHEIFERLTREEHRGRYLFWFSNELFSQKWFEARVNESIENAKPRYTPEINVELPITKLFDGLGRTTNFYKRIDTLHAKIKKSFSTSITRKDNKHPLKPASNKLSYAFEKLCQSLSKINPQKASNINLREISESAIETIQSIREYISNIENLKKEKDDNPNGNKNSKNYSNSDYPKYYLNKLESQLYELRNFVESDEAKVSNTSSLLILGDAGNGKTHLLCDIASNRVKKGLPTVLLLGEQFNNDEPWKQIIGLLGLDCSREEFLGALETSAQAKKSRALLIIDALNECENKKIFYKHFSGILATLSNFPNIGIAVSVRSPYEHVVIPKHLTPEKLIRVEHTGFAQNEYQATRTFFEYYGIRRPSVPLLNPEFQNPLFLKLFCIGLKNRGMLEIPPGFDGLTSVFDFLIDSINEKLSEEENLNFRIESQLVHKSLEKLAELMASSHKPWLPHNQAEITVNQLLPREGYHNTLFKHLLNEGLLAEDRLWQSNNEKIDVIRFSYERLSDHLIIKYLLDWHLDCQNPCKAFEEGQVLGEIVKNISSCWKNRGLIDALSIQIPERVQKELAQVAPICADFEPIRNGFVQSLIWREPTAINEYTRQYINNYIVHYEDSQYLFLDTLLVLASKPQHPYNAEFLHKHLMKLDMSDRDVLWSIFLHKQYGSYGAVDRLVEWAASEEDKQHIDNQGIYLVAIAITWFLTTSNRFLRDRSTQALVNLLTPRIHILRKVIAQFIGVNDLYVLERCFAVAYGCAMRSIDIQAVTELAYDTYEFIFKSGNPIPHILLRDYARGVIEVALNLNSNIKPDLNLVRPPYSVNWLTYLPSKKDIQNRINNIEGTPQEINENNISYYRCKSPSLSSIVDSLLDNEGLQGDFARYIIGTNSNYFQWHSTLLKEAEKPDYEEIYEDFITSLTARQTKKWVAFKTVRDNIQYYYGLNIEKRLELFEEEFSDEDLTQALTDIQASLCKSMGKKKNKIFKNYILPYLENPSKYSGGNYYNDLFDLGLAQRWIFHRVLELGWSADKFAHFDSRVNYPGSQRSAHKAERIGKKYQWIAYHEFLAYVSDNFKFRKDKSIISDRRGYQGPWQGWIRDIDPSCLLLKPKVGDSDEESPSWWFPIPYNSWDKHPNEMDWLQDLDDKPNIEPIIDIIYPQNRSHWLTLETHISWNDPLLSDRNNIPKRQIWYQLRSYLVHKQDIDHIYSWAIQQNFWGRWMPESHESSQMFLGEFFWSPAFEYHNVPYFGYDGWTCGQGDKIPKKVLVTADQYFRETSTHDCSVEESYRIYLPSKSIVDLMGLKWNGIAGHFFNKAGSLIAFDPSVQESGPSSCLVHREKFLEFLKANDYDIFWTLLGEKNILNSNSEQGRLEMSGAFRIQDGDIKGKINYKTKIYCDD
ncbi:AVAST type 2 anti-phage system protein Avs2 [Leptothoe sp. ISB3NOV94-8A]